MKLNNPNILVLWVLRLLSAFPFALFYSSLQLYFLKIGLSNGTILVGSILALSFGLSLLAGYICERYISYKEFFLISILFQTIGCYVFCSQNISIILWLSSVFLLGCMGTTISLNMLLTKSFDAHDTSREKAFFILYTCLNLGYFIGYFLSGHFSNHNQYHYLPYISLFSVISNYLLLFLLKNRLNFKDTACKKNQKIKLVFVYISTLLGIRLFIEYALLTNILVIIGWVLAASYMYYKLVTKFPMEKQNIYIFYILLFSALVFWSVYFLAPMALMIFIKYYVNLYIGNYLIAPQWLQNINTLVIVLGSLWFGIKLKDNSNKYITTQFFKGLVFIGMGFLMLYFSILFKPQFYKINIAWIIFSFTLQSIGELYIGPIGYALIGRLIPSGSQSIMTGIWATILGVGGAIASFVSIIVIPSTKSVEDSINKFNHLFIWMTVITISLSIFILIYKTCFLSEP